VGGLISPSSGLIPVLADLVQTSPASSGHPLLLRAVLPGSHYMIAVPLPANNYFLNVLATAPGPSLYLWFCLSAAAEFLVSWPLPPGPASTSGSASPPLRSSWYPGGYSQLPRRPA